MKKFLTLLLTFTVYFSTFAEPQYLIEKSYKHGGSGSFGLKYTQLKNEPAAVVGGSGGWIIGNTLQIGMGGYSIITKDVLNPSTAKEALKVGYGGLFLKYIANSDNLVHFTLSCLGGMGSGVFDGTHYSKSNEIPQLIFVVEPELNAVINVTRNFRLGLGVGYRIVSCDNLVSPDRTKTYTAQDLSNYTAGINFEWGKF